ncbi:MAG: hypothetical protein JW709_04345 [Sedimentisphaerales bacterium]|nr:hypothetical protein [Sedimentisphaerales bacterium]
MMPINREQAVEVLKRLQRLRSWMRIYGVSGLIFVFAGLLPFIKLRSDLLRSNLVGLSGDDIWRDVLQIGGGFLLLFIGSFGLYLNCQWKNYDILLKHLAQQHKQHDPYADVSGKRSDAD